MFVILRSARRLLQEERGQIAILFALLFMVILGLAAIVLDFGNLYLTRRRAQNAADAAALAGARELPDPTCFVDPLCPARSAALQYTALNGFTGGSDGVTVTTQVFTKYYEADSLRVTIQKPAGLILAHIPFGGGSTRTVAAQAVAIVGMLGGANVQPWGIYHPDTTGDCSVNGVPCNCDIGPCDGDLQSPYFGFNFGVQYEIKLGPQATGPGPGNFQGLAVDGTGGNIYRETIARGGTINKVYVCQCVPNETGNLAGPTYQGLCALVGGALQGQDCIGGDQHMVEHIVTPPPGCCFWWDEPPEDGVFLPKGCNGIEDPTQCAEREPGAYVINKDLDGGNLCLRLVTVPIVKDYPSGSSEDVLVLGFALFFIEDFSRSGNDMSIWGYFIDSTLPGAWSPYQPAFGIKVVRLVE